VTDETLLEAIEKMDKALEHTQHQFSTVRTGRASPALVERLSVNYYGSDVPLQQLATFQVPEARMLVIKPHDRNTMTAIEKAIRDSDLGLNPATQGDVVRVPMPALTEERRRELIKVVKHEGENAKVAIRNLRRDANQHLKDLLKKHAIPEDQERRAQDEVQKLTDRYVAEVDKLLHQKEADLMQV
jgi:ribosome recycling factor